MKFDPNQFAFEMLKVMASEEHQSLFPSAPRIKIASEEEIAVPLQYSLDAVNDVADEIVNSGAELQEITAGLVGLSEHLESLGQEEGAELVLRKLAHLQGGWTQEKEKELQEIHEDEINNALSNFETLREDQINRPYQRAVSNYGIQQNADDGEGEDDLIEEICSILGKYIKDDDVCEKLANKLIKLFDSEDKNESIDSDLTSAKIMQLINQELAGRPLTEDEFSEIAEAIKASRPVDLSGMAPIDPNLFADNKKLPKHINLLHKAVDEEHNDMFPVSEEPLEELPQEKLKESVAYYLTKQIIKIAKANGKAKVRNRPAPIFDAKSPKVKDNKDHFPIDTIGRARNALARVEQFDEAPPWWKGSLSELKNAVKRAVKAKYPSIAIGGKKDSNDAKDSKKKTKSQRMADLPKNKAGQPINRSPDPSRPRRMAGVKPDTSPRPKKGDRVEVSPTKAETGKEIYDSAIRAYEIGSGSVGHLGDAIRKLKEKRDHSNDEYISKLQNLLDNTSEAEKKTDSKDSPKYPNILSFARSVRHDIVQYKALTKEHKTQERLDEINRKISGLERMIDDFCEENSDNEKGCNILKDILENIKNVAPKSDAPKSDANDARESPPAPLLRLENIAKDVIYPSDYDEHARSMGSGAGVFNLHDEKGRIITKNLINALQAYVVAHKSRKGTLAKQIRKELNLSDNLINELETGGVTNEVLNRAKKDIELAMQVQKERQETPSRVTSTNSGSALTALIDAAKTYKGSRTANFLNALERAAFKAGRALAAPEASYKGLTNLKAINELNRSVIEITGVSVKPKLEEGFSAGSVHVPNLKEKLEIIKQLGDLSKQISKESDLYAKVKTKLTDGSNKVEAQKFLEKMNKLRAEANSCIHILRNTQFSKEEFDSCISNAQKLIPDMESLIEDVKNYLGIVEPQVVEEKPVTREILLKDLQEKIQNLLDDDSVSELQKEKLRRLYVQMNTAEFEGPVPKELFEQAVNNIMEGA
jgi:hypothetical protein